MTEEIRSPKVGLLNRLTGVYPTITTDPNLTIPDIIGHGCEVHTDCSPFTGLGIVTSKKCVEGTTTIEIELISMEYTGHKNKPEKIDISGEKKFLELIVDRQGTGGPDDYDCYGVFSPSPDGIELIHIDIKSLHKD